MTENTDNRPFFPEHSVKLPDPDAKEPAKETSPVSGDSPETTQQPAGNSILYRTASIYSWIMCPLLMPVLGMLLIFSLSILAYASIRTKLSFILVVGVVNVVIPMVAVILLKAMKIVQDVGLNNRRERSVPYVITAVCLTFTGFFLAAKRAPSWVEMFFMGGAVAAVINLIVNLRWKISAHAAGAAGVIAMLIRMSRVGMPQHDITPWIVVAILLTGLLGTARVYMGRHTLMQVLAGYASGFCSVYLLSLFAPQ